MTVTAAAPFPPRSVAWRSAVVIFVITVIAMADRMSIAMLIGPIKRDFAIGDFQASLLVGALSEYVLGEAQLGTAIRIVIAGAMAVTLVALLALRPRLDAYLAAQQ